jgi:hypothetical protein
MDADQVNTFCDVVTQLIGPLATYAGTEPGKRDANDDLLVRQLRVAGAAINEALSQVARLTPPMAPPVPRPAPASEPQLDRRRPARCGEPYRRKDGAGTSR